jgi:flagellar basal-body rod protein FlgC
MISSVNSSISALKAFGKKMGVTADNVANGASEEFKKSRAVLTEGAHSEIQVDIEKIETPGPIVSEIEDGEMVETELSNVDLVEEIPQSIIAQRSFEANLKSIQTQEETLDSILDIIG